MYNRQIDMEFVRRTFSSSEAADYYEKTGAAVGLWMSERILTKRYFNKSDRILDIGCGTGRTTIGLHKLGFSRVEGLDIAEAMIEQASLTARRSHLPILWHVGDVTDLTFAEGTFDAALFSFNGLENIPGEDLRIRALAEIRRVLRPGGTFIFTTHDRGRLVDGAAYPWETPSFWEHQEGLWAKGTQDSRLIDFGDFIYEDEIDGKRHEVFLHYSSRDEIERALALAGFDLIESPWRPDICEEPPQIKEFSLECQFWVARNA